jgi:hypothetical protein
MYLTSLFSANCLQVRAEYTPEYTFEDGGQDNTDQHGSKIFYIGENR